MIAKIQYYLHPRNWTWSRLVRLLLGLLSIAAGVDGSVHLITLAGIALTMSALLRVGCADSCDTTSQSR